jgi:hypothetical protein
VAGSTSPANDGTFVISSVSANGKSATYTNSNPGVTEAFVSGTVSIQYPAGNDTNTGLSFLSPKLTFQAIINLVPDNISAPVTVNVRGVYDALTSGIVTYINKYISDSRTGTNASADVFLCVDGGPGVYVVADNAGSPWTADISSSSTIGLTTAGWTPDLYAGYWVEILSGACTGQTRLIQGHDATTITPARVFSTNPGACKFRIIRPVTEFKGYQVLRASCAGGGRLLIQRLYLSGITQLSFDANAGSAEIGLIVSDTSFNGVTPFLIEVHGAFYAVHNYYDPITSVRRNALSYPMAGISQRGAVFTGSGGIIILGGATEAQLRGTYCKYLTAHNGAFCQLIRGSRFNQVYILNSSMLTYTEEGYAPTRFGGTSALGIANSPAILLSHSWCRFYKGAYTKVSDVSAASGHGIDAVHSQCYITGVTTNNGNNTKAGVYVHLGSAVFCEVTTPTITGTIGDFSTDGTTSPLLATWAAVMAGTPYSDATEAAVITKYKQLLNYPGYFD